MVIKSSPKLYAFYVAYNNWLKAGALSNEFSNRCGLCNNLMNFLSSRYHSEYREMLRQFKEAGLDRSYPFSTENDYYKEKSDNESHLNANRIAWVKSRIADGVKE